jgi:hypothetical protein
MASAAPSVSGSMPGKATIDVAVAMLRPVIEAAIADTDVSADRALAIVVVDGAHADDGPLAEYGFGAAGHTRVDYSVYARDKARIAAHERADTSVVREREAQKGSADLPLVGGVHRRGVTVGVSGAMPWFDEAFGVMLVELVHALDRQRAGR